MDASADYKAIAQQPKQRSKVTNHRDLLPNLMGTSSGARRFRDLVNSYISDLGGISEISEIKLGLLRRLASVVVISETLEARLLKGEKVNILGLCGLISTSIRLSSRLGLERVTKDVSVLGKYLDRRDEIDDIDLVQRLDDLHGK